MALTTGYWMDQISSERPLWLVVLLVAWTLFILANTGDVVPAINGPPLVDQTVLRGGIVSVKHYGLLFLPTYLAHVLTALQRLGGETLAFVALLWGMKRNHQSASKARITRKDQQPLSN